MSEKEAEASKSKRPMDSTDTGKDSEDDDKRSMRKKARVDYSEEKKAAEPPKAVEGNDDDDDIQVCVGESPNILIISVTVSTFKPCDPILKAFKSILRELGLNFFC